MTDQAINIFELTEEELKEQYDQQLKALNNYQDIDKFIEEVLDVDRRKIMEAMRDGSGLFESQYLHDLKYANFCSNREAKHKKIAIFKSTHKRPKF